MAITVRRLHAMQPDSTKRCCRKEGTRIVKRSVAYCCRRHAVRVHAQGLAAGTAVRLRYARGPGAAAASILGWARARAPTTSHHPSLSSHRTARRHCCTTVPGRDVVMGYCSHASCVRPRFCERNWFRPCRQFTLLRHPISRLLSAYSYFCRSCEEGGRQCGKASPSSHQSRSRPSQNPSPLGHQRWIRSG